jgi:DNA invertase Pin-like site-specific DNA recombinase
MGRTKVAADGKHDAVYLRVTGRGQDTASQEPDLKRWAATQDGPVVWYRDKFTGKTMDRPGWNKLAKDIETGKVRKLACWRLDRLGRTAKGLTALFEDLVARNVNLVSLKDGLDLSTPAGRLMANVLASVAAYETEIRGERIRAGQEVARAAGKHLGRPIGIRTRIKVTQEQDKLVRRMKSEGETIARIARATGLSRVTVYRVLDRGAALGK